MPGKIFLHRASDKDYLAFYGAPPPEVWAGFCAEENGKVIAFGWVLIDQVGRAWTGVDKIAGVPPLMLHRAIADFFRMMAEEGIPALHAICDETIPRAARWLEWLGFSIDTTLGSVYMANIDKSLPVWKRTLSSVAR